MSLPADDLPAPQDAQALILQARALSMRADGKAIGDIRKELGLRDNAQARSLLDAAMEHVGAGVITGAANRILGRYELMYRALEDRIAAGDPQAIEAARKVLADERAMLGIDAAVDTGDHIIVVEAPWERAREIPSLPAPAPEG